MNRFDQRRTPQARRSERYPVEYQRNRLLALERDRHRCRLQLPGCLGHATTADHIISVARGGGHDLSNLQAACSPCNGRKGAVEGARKRNRRHGPPRTVRRVTPLDL